MDEIWKDIKDYEGLYQISNLGNVRSLDRIVNTKTGQRKIKGKIMTPKRSGKICKDGSYYLKINLSDINGSKKSYSIHRLVALHFCNNPDPELFTEVNHIDENKQNNVYSNLEWCDRKINNHHSLITEKLNESKKKAVLQYSLNGEFIMEYSGIREAARGVGLKTHRWINSCCKGEVKQAGGYVWRYKE